MENTQLFLQEFAWVWDITDLKGHFHGPTSFVRSNIFTHDIPLDIRDHFHNYSTPACANINLNKLCTSSH